MRPDRREARKLRKERAANNEALVQIFELIDMGDGPVARDVTALMGREPKDLPSLAASIKRRQRAIGCRLEELEAWPSTR